MSEDTTTLTKQVVPWLERRLGHVLVGALPVVLMMLAGWIWQVEAKINRIELSAKENEAQWKALYENRERTDQLTVEVRVYKLLFERIKEFKSLSTLSGKNVDNYINTKKHTAAESKPVLKRLHRYEVQDFRQEQLQELPKLAK